MLVFSETEGLNVVYIYFNICSPPVYLSWYHKIINIMLRVPTSDSNLKAGECLWNVDKVSQNIREVLKKAVLGLIAHAPQSHQRSTPITISYIP